MQITHTIYDVNLCLARNLWFPTKKSLVPGLQANNYRNSTCTGPLDLVNLWAARSSGFVPGNLAKASIVHVARVILWPALTSSARVSARARTPLNTYNKKDLVSNPTWWEARINIQSLVIGVYLAFALSRCYCANRLVPGCIPFGQYQAEVP